MALEPTARSSPISGAGRDRAGGRPEALAGGVVEAERLRGLDEPVRPELGAHRAEGRVARVGEDLFERAAAELAVGVLELDALQQGRADHGVGVARLDDAVLQSARQRDDLEGRARRLGQAAVVAGQRQHLARARAQDGDAPEAPGERGHGGGLEVHVDRGLHRLARLGLRRGEDAVAREQRPAGAAGQALLELRLEPAEPDGGLGRIPEPRVALGLVLGDRPDRADHLGRQRPEVRRAIRTGREHLAVARLQLPARRQLGRALEPLGVREAREHEPGVKATPATSSASVVTAKRSVPSTVPNTRVSASIGTLNSSPS